MLNPEYIKEHGLSIQEYYDTIDEKYLNRWDKKLKQVNFSAEQRAFLQNDMLPIEIVVFSADWCSDCQTAVPILMKFDEYSDFITLRILDKDKNEDQMDDYMIAGGKRTPLVLFMNEKYQEVGRWAEKSAYTYKLLFEAKKEAGENPGSSYREIKSTKFKQSSDFMFEENIRELFDQLYKSSMLIAASASPEKIELIAANSLN